MALTNQQMMELGFKPSMRGRGGLSKTKKYDSLVYAINETDFLYTGYNPFRKQVNFKTIWKSFKDPVTHERITYQVASLADTGYFELKAYIHRTNIQENVKAMEQYFDTIEDNSEFNVVENYAGNVAIVHPNDTNLELPDLYSDEVIQIIRVSDNTTPIING